MGSFEDFVIIDTIVGSLGGFVGELGTFIGRLGALSLGGR